MSQTTPATSTSQLDPSLLPVVVIGAGPVGLAAAAHLDDEGGLWATAYALSELSEAGEATIAELVKRAVG